MDTSKLNYQPLGASGLKVSKLWLGTMMFGDQTDEAQAADIVAATRDAGVNAIDTANAYAGGESERITGRLIAADRERWVLATKLANPMGPGPNDRGLSRRHIMAAVDASLRRLGTDFVDVLYLHREDASTPLEETLAAIATLIERGKVHHFGLSNFRAWRIARVAEMCRAMGLQPPVVCQPPYNAMSRAIETEVLPCCAHFGVSNFRAWRVARVVEMCRAMGIAQPIVCQPPYSAMSRQIETELLPCCAHYGIAAVVYGPLARGVLSGKYPPGAAPPEGSRAARNDSRIMQTEFRPESLALAGQMAEHAGARNLTPTQLALGWVWNNTLVNGVIGGPRTLAQWQGYLGALDTPFTSADETFVSGLVAAGHASTAGYNDPQYPLTGRVPRTP